MSEEKKTILNILGEEREKHKKELEKLQAMLRDLEYDKCGYIPEEIRKFVNKQEIQKEARFHLQMIADLDSIKIGIMCQESEVKILGTIYEGEMYPELLEVLKNAHLKFNEDTFTVYIS